MVRFNLVEVPPYPLLFALSSTLPSSCIINKLLSTVRYKLWHLLELLYLESSATVCSCCRVRLSSAPKEAFTDPSCKSQCYAEKRNGKSGMDERRNENRMELRLCENANARTNDRPTIVEHKLFVDRYYTHVQYRS